YNGPVWIIPAPGGQAMPPPLPPPPVYGPPPVYQPPPTMYYRPPVYMPRYAPLPRYTYTPPVHQEPRGPVVSVGLRFTALGVSSQQVFGQDVNLLGAGLQVRFRNRGHWGFEVSFDALHADINNGAFVRSSYPFAVAPMLYIFKNRPESHFNIY